MNNQWGNGPDDDVFTNYVDPEPDIQPVENHRVVIRNGSFPFKKAGMYVLGFAFLTFCVFVALVVLVCLGAAIAGTFAGFASL